MKILKTAEQQNFIVDIAYHSTRDLQDMQRNGEIGTIESKCGISGCDNELRVFASDCDEIKVVYEKEYGCYKTVAILKTGKKAYITL